MAFEGLSDRLEAAFKRLRSKGNLTESDVKEAMREVRLALLEADVNYKVAKDFTNKVTERAIGSHVLESLTPAQMVIKIVNEELTELMGGTGSKLAYASHGPTIIMMCGLQGSGKTTHCAKIALKLKTEGHRPLLVACDVYRPAAIKQLQEAVDDAQEAVDTSASLINYYQEQIDAGVDLSASLTEEQENYDKLYTKLVAAKNNYTTKSIEAEKTLKEAELSAKNASSQYSVDVSGADSDITDAKDTLSDAEEALEAFEAAIGDDGTIYAEYTGNITDLSYEAGDTISSGATVATFSNTDAVTITVSVSEEDITNIAVGDVVEIELSAYEDQTFAGEVESIDTSSSSGSSTVSYNVTAAFTGDITGIYTDMTGNVTFISRQVTDVLYVSNKAVQSDGTTSYVKVKDADGTIRMVDVETGFSDGVNVEITSGLTEGETVLIESQVTE